MKIAVLVKQVPDSDEVKIDAEKGTMVRNGHGNIVNPLDLNALQAAVEAKRRFGAEISVISMGPPQADGALREALALGADRAFLLSDRKLAGADSWATSAALSKAIQKTGPYDLILAGSKATDGETGQVGPETAAILDIPFTTYVSAMKIDGAQVLVKRTVEDGVETQRLPMPALVTVLSDMNEPEMPTLSGKKYARRTQISLLSAEDIGLESVDMGLNGSPTHVVRIDHPKLSRETAFYSGSRIDEGIERLMETLKELSII